MQRWSLATSERVAYALQEPLGNFGDDVCSGEAGVDAGRAAGGGGRRARLRNRGADAVSGPSYN